MNQNHEIRLITVELRRFTRLGKEFPTGIIPFVDEIQNIRSISDEIFLFWSDGKPWKRPRKICFPFRTCKKSTPKTHMWPASHLAPGSWLPRFWRWHSTPSKRSSLWSQRQGIGAPHQWCSNWEWCSSSGWRISGWVLLILEILS